MGYQVATDGRRDLGSFSISNVKVMRETAIPYETPWLKMFFVDGGSGNLDLLKQDIQIILKQNIDPDVKGLYTSLFNMVSNAESYIVITDD